MADEPNDDQAVQPEAKRPMIVGIVYLAALLVIGLLVLLVAGRIVRF